MRRRTTTIVDNREESNPRDQRYVKAALGGAAAAIVLAPILKEGFYQYFSFFELSGDDSLIYRFGEEAFFLNGALRTIVLESGEKLHLLSHSLNKTQTQLKMISYESNANFELLRKLLGNLIRKRQWLLRLLPRPL